MSEQFTEKWGRFPPHLHHNIDQVPLPIVVSQDDTFTCDDDKDVHIAGHCKGGLPKLKFTMHVVVNTGEGKDCDGHIELIGKGKVMHGTCFSVAERSQWNKDVKMFFQPNAWMNQEVMALSVKRFNSHMLKQWSSKAKALLTCNHIDAHGFQGTKDIMANFGRVLLFCFPPAVTNAVQPIYAGCGTSVRCAIGRLLDEWLMKSDNLEMWEAGMTAGQCRVPISNNANEEALQNDSAGISCFHCCGVLLTTDGSEDGLIKPQGRTLLSLTIPELVDMTGAEFNDPEVWDGLLTKEDKMNNATDDVGDSKEAVDAEDQDGDDDDMREAVEREEQAAGALDGDTEEGEEDNAIEIEELRGGLCSGQRRTQCRRLVEEN